MDPNELNVMLNLPCLKGRIGDWFYYCSTMSFCEIAKRVKLPVEIDKKYKDPNLKLGEWIQRDIENGRIEPIANYLLHQNERFFNSIVLGIYDGEPSWQEFDIKISESTTDNQLTEKDLRHFSQTFGILRLSGNESIFAIDGQHRVMGIRKASIENSKKFQYDEVSVIFIAHKTDENGLKRTRKLFSTLNRYAKPVNKGEIIALSEDDNCAIITRMLIDENNYLKNKIAINKNKSISQNNSIDFTSVIMLYDIVFKILTNNNIVGYGGLVKGRDKTSYTNKRLSDSEIKSDYKIIENLLDKLITQIPVFTNFFINNNTINREDKSSSLLFKVIGQNIFFDVIKASINEDRIDQTISFFISHDFSLNNPIWNTIFWDNEKQALNTDVANQKYAKILFFDKLNIPTKKTSKDLEIQKNFNLSL
ncbi:DGQHR domain-containing protein [Aquirufa ecclesiirivi]|uniref:DGQHR domain-containing protein n=1 Tax=Aquirufa ecclesiirivi TaxID=2715124 RepID=UPI003BAE3BA9